MHAVQHGMSNRAIAARRGISTDAVKFHVSNAIAKLGLADRRALRRWFREPRASALGRKEKWMAHFNDPEGRPLAIMAQVKA